MTLGMALDVVGDEPLLVRRQPRTPELHEEQMHAPELVFPHRPRHRLRRVRAWAFAAAPEDPLRARRLGLRQLAPTSDGEQQAEPRDMPQHVSRQYATAPGASA